MAEPGFMKYRNYLIVGILIVLAVFTLWVRLLPAGMGGTTDILNLVGSDDPLYNLRQIEQMTHNFPNYGWFEAMTLYPFGQVIHWGPVFIWIITSLCLLTGATTRPEIIGLALTIPPIMAAAMVPLMFVLGRRIGGTITGLFSAFFIAVISGQYFFRSLYGYLDHHIAEVLFSTLFIFCYIWTLAYVRRHPVDFTRPETVKVPGLLSVACGLTYMIGLWTMATMLLFALIVSLYTLLQFLWDYTARKKNDALVLVNGITFAIAILSFAAFGVHLEGLQFDYYTMGHPVAYAQIILGTLFLYAIAGVVAERKLTRFFVGLVAATGAALLIFMAALPELFHTYLASLDQFFGQNLLYLTIQEARSWTLAEAWDNFNIGLILAALGVAVLLYQLWREKRSEHLLILVWGIFIIVATWQHIRYEYYIAVPIALLSAFFCGFVVDLGRPQIVALLGREKKTERQAPDEPKEKGKDKGKQKGKKAQKARPAEAKAIDYRILGAVGAIIVLAAIFAFFQASYDLKVASSGTIRMNQDWKEALEWMNTRTPDPGLDYYRIYDKATFSYPPQSYGVMSWWDYGHMITYIAKRIPNANPFQSGVAGENGAATFFLSQSEERTDAIADALGVKYVVTDIEMDTGKFWAMATWYNTTAGAAPYHGTYLVPDQSVSGGYSTVTLYDAPYFQTMISRLHNYDGSMGTPDKAYYIEYTTTGSPYPTVVKAQLLDVAAARADVEAFNRNPNPGYQAAVLTPAILSPLDPVPALRHYRLVHESPSNVFSQSPPDLKYVKVFEHVPGARIAGDGVIELDLVTNAGRNFTYRQASQNGEFVVPYATSGSPNEVRAAGKYRIVGTGREIDVPEEAVQQGLQVR